MSRGSHPFHAKAKGGVWFYSSIDRITTIDADGVALAAIQGLYEIVREQQDLLERQQAEIERLREGQRADSRGQR